MAETETMLVIRGRNIRDEYEDLEENVIGSDYITLALQRWKRIRRYKDVHIAQKRITTSYSRIRLSE